MATSRCSRPRPRPRPKAAGFALIEAIVGMLIFSIGILGLIGLLGTMTRAQSAAAFRSEATALSGELIGSMWADSAANRLAYASSGAACTYGPCARWIQKVRSQLPKGNATVSIDSASGITTISISWTVPADGAHSYVTSTSIF